MGDCSAAAARRRRPDIEESPRPAKAATGGKKDRFASGLAHGAEIGRHGQAALGPPTDAAAGRRDHLVEDQDRAGCAWAGVRAPPRVRRDPGGITAACCTSPAPMMSGGEYVPGRSRPRHQWPRRSVNREVGIGPGGGSVLAGRLGADPPRRVGPDRNPSAEGWTLHRDVVNPAVIVPLEPDDIGFAGPRRRASRSAAWTPRFRRGRKGATARPQRHQLGRQGPRRLDSISVCAA